MSIQYHFFRYNQASIQYFSRGTGNKILLAFHGFGQDAHAFDPLIETLKDTYTIYSFNLFFHGKSYWHNKDKAFSKKDWENILTFFLKKHGIQHFDLLGYSMGAKMALSTIEIYPEKVNKIILLSPDGIKTSFWYNLTTFPFLMQYLFKRTVNRPGFYFSLVSILRKLRIVNKGIIRFSNNQMNTKGKRLLLYRTWITYRKLYFNNNTLLKIIHSHNIKVRIFLGRSDRIVPYAQIRSFLNHLRQYDLSIVNEGHTYLINKVAGYYHKRASLLQKRSSAPVL